MPAPRAEGVEVTHGPILYVVDVTVSFDGFKPERCRSRRRRRTALHHRPNGAGKTTMGLIPADPSRRRHGFLGSTIDLLRMTESRIANSGIGRKFQRPTVFETLTVFENMELALKTARSPLASLRARLDSEQLDCIEQTLIRVNLRDAVWRTAGILSHGQKQWLEIGMLLVQQPRTDPAGRTGGRHDRRGENDRTAELCLSSRGRTIWWWWSMTWSSSRRSRAGSRCCMRDRC